jgi:hypothetical protein
VTISGSFSAVSGNGDDGDDHFLSLEKRKKKKEGLRHLDEGYSISQDEGQKRGKIRRVWPAM